MKKHGIIIAIVLILCMIPSIAFSADLLEKIEVYKNYARIVVNGNPLNSQTFLYGNSQYAPVREVAEALGAKLTHDSNSKTLNITSAANSTTSELTYAQLVDVYDPIIKTDSFNINPDSVDGFKLEKNGIKTDVQLSFESGLIRITPQTWMDYNSDYSLKLFINNGNRLIIKFRTGGLPKLIPEGGRKIILVPADPSKGFNYPYYMVLPKKINVDKNKGKKNYLFVETHNTGKVSDDLTFHINEAYTVAEGNSAKIADELGLPRIVPIIVRPQSTIYNQMVYTHALSRNSIILDELKKQAGVYNEVFNGMDRVDRQVVNMIKHANEYLRQSGWQMEDKIFMWGFSASGDFTNRFSFLYPELVKAACFSGFPVLPVMQESGYNMIYPLGAYDYKNITGKNFSLDEYNSVARLGYVGSADTNDPCILDTPYEQQIVNELLAVREYPDKWPKAKKIFEKSGGQAQASVYIGAGHETFYKGMTKDYMNFFTANRESEKPVYVKPSDPANTLTDIYSNNVIEVKNAPFSYDKTTITEAFWSGTVPKTLPKGFIDWYKSLDTYKYKDHELLISIDEWDNNNEDQMGERIRKVGGRLLLQAKGYKDLRLVITEGSMTNGDGSAQVYFAYIENVEDIVSNVKYNIVDSSGHWIVADGVYVERPKQ